MSEKKKPFMRKDRKVHFGQKRAFKNGVNAEVLLTCARKRSVKVIRWTTEEIRQHELLTMNKCVFKEIRLRVIKKICYPVLITNRYKRKHYLIFSKNFVFSSLGESVRSINHIVWPTKISSFLNSLFNKIFTNIKLSHTHTHTYIYFMKILQRRTIISQSNLFD